MKKPYGESDISYGSYLTIKESGVRRSGYLIIKGSVKNNGIKTVTQCVLNIIKSDKNSGTVSRDKLYVLGDIAPGIARTFHSMTAWPESAKTYNLTIKDVKVKQ